MITLITGAPGTGKTAALVKLLEELAQGRALFVNGIPDLKINHVALDKPDEWMTVVPDGAAVVIDEVQNVWRPRGPGSRVPDHVAALETHRHRGLDFFIITQGPNLLDSNVRALVGRHVHLRDLGVLGRWWYEWPECADNCRTGWRNAPIKKRYKLPRAIFDKYKSASLHVKPIRSFPMALVVLVLAIIGTGAAGWFGYSRLVARGSDAKSGSGSSPALAAPAGPSLSAQAPRVGVSSGPVDERVDFDPRIADRPWTAPAYDSLRVVVRVPYPQGGMCVGDDCSCYADGERLPMSSRACRDWMERRPFNPYVGVDAASGNKPSPASPVASGGPVKPSVGVRSVSYGSPS